MEGGNNLDTNLLVCDSNNHIIRHLCIQGDTDSSSKIAPFTKKIFGGIRKRGFVDGSNSQARFANPSGIAIMKTKPISFVCDHDNNSIRMINLETNMVFTVATKGILEPIGIAIHRDQKQLFISEFRASFIRKFDISKIPDKSCELSSKVVIFQVGFGIFSIAFSRINENILFVSAYSHESIRAFNIVKQTSIEVLSVRRGFKDAAINGPRGICVDDEDNLYFCDFRNNAIRMIDKQFKVFTIVGNPLKQATVDGNRLKAILNNPNYITIDKKTSSLIFTQPDAIRMLSIPAFFFQRKIIRIVWINRVLSSACQSNFNKREILRLILLEISQLSTLSLFLDSGGSIKKAQLQKAIDYSKTKTTLVNVKQKKMDAQSFINFVSNYMK